MPTTSTPIATQNSAAPSERQWWVYMVLCHDGSLYTGVSTDVQRRLREHNGELAGGARYTRGRRPVALVYREACSDRQQACRLESSIKSLNRVMKDRLIKTGTASRLAR